MRFRKLRIAWTVGCGIACALLVVLWVRSYFAFDRISGCLGKTNSLILVSYFGRFSAVSVPFNLAWDLPNWDSGPIHSYDVTLPEMSRLQLTWSIADSVWPERTVLGMGWIHHKLYPNIPNGETGWHPEGLTGRSYASYACTGAVMPSWLTACSLSALAYLPWLRLRFSLRTLLIAMTLVAVVLGLTVAVL